MKKRDQSGDKNSNWKGGRVGQSKGYIMVYVPNGGYELEHRVVAEKMIGRKLRKYEVVHHINRIKTDNRPENLQVMTILAHAHLHHGKKLSHACPRCGRMTKNKKYCSNKCSAYYFNWPSDRALLRMSRTMSTREISVQLGKISHVSVWYKLKSIVGSDNGIRPSC